MAPALAKSSMPKDLEKIWKIRTHKVLKGFSKFDICTYVTSKGQSLALNIVISWQPSNISQFDFASISNSLTVLNMIATYSWGHWTTLAKHPECDILLQLSFFKSQECCEANTRDGFFFKSLWLQSHITYLRIF